MNASESGGTANNRGIEALKDFPMATWVIKGQTPSSQTYRYAQVQDGWLEKEPMEELCRECTAIDDYNTYSSKAGLEIDNRTQWGYT